MEKRRAPGEEDSFESTGTMLDSWVERFVADLDSSEMNSAGRSELKRMFISKVTNYPISIPAVVTVLERLAQTSRQAQGLLEKISDKEFISRVVNQTEIVPSPAEFGILLSQIMNSQMARDVLTCYIRLPAFIFENKKVRTKEDWDEGVQIITQIPSSLLTSTFMYNLSDEVTANLVKLIDVDSLNAEKNSLAALMSALSHTEDSSVALQAGAIQDVIGSLQMNLLGLSEDTIAHHSHQKFSRQLKDVVAKVRANPFYEKWTTDIRNIHSHIESQDLHRYTIVTYPSEYALVTIADQLRLLGQARIIEEDPQLSSDYLLLPDGGQIFSFQRTGVKQLTSREDMRNLFRNYYTTKESTEIAELVGFMGITEYMTPEFQLDFLESMVPEIELEKVREDVIKSRERAAGGFSTVSERGDKVRIFDQGSEAETYLHSLGIRECTFFQTDKGIRIELVWYTNKFSFLMSDSYQIQHLEELSEEKRLWIEHLCLKYIGSIKNQLFETEPIEKPEGLGDRRVFAGRRPYLKVLPFGHKTRLITDLGRGESLDDEESYVRRMHEFIRFHFGVSLDTLNGLFSSIQHDVSLFNPREFEELFRLYEQQIPPGFTALTDWKSVRSMIAEAMRRSTRRSVPVRYSRGRGLLRQSGGEFQQTKGEFEITLVNEAKSKGLDIQPMTFYCPEVSSEVFALSQSE